MHPKLLKNNNKVRWKEKNKIERQRFYIPWGWGANSDTTVTPTAKQPESLDKDSIRSGQRDSFNFHQEWI